MLKGMDLHSGKWVSSWDNIKAAGIQVVINKATEGTYYKDKYLSYRREQCKKLGILFGIYHFAGHQDVEQEVSAFINYTKGLTFNTIFWLDIEDVPSYSWKAWRKADAINFVNRFDSLFRSKTGKDIGVYCSQSFYEDYLRGNIRSNMKLWIAHYGINNNPYPTQSWQYTDKGSVAGEKETFDMDLFQENILVGANSNNPTKGGKKKMKCIVISGKGPDERAANYLADYLNCPVMTNDKTFDYSQFENVIGVGGKKEQYTSYLTRLISGVDRYSTAQAVLDFIKNGGK